MVKARLLCTAAVIQQCDHKLCTHQIQSRYPVDYTYKLQSLPKTTDISFDFRGRYARVTFSYGDRWIDKFFVKHVY